jgi:hypothetical protein
VAGWYAALKVALTDLMYYAPPAHPIWGRPTERLPLGCALWADHDNVIEWAEAAPVLTYEGIERR